MFEQKPEALRKTVQQLSATASTDPTGWFEVLYEQAQGDPAKVPWAKLAPHPYLQEWLRQKDRPPESTSAIVIGCGLGDDAERLQQQGYQVRAFDVSATAIDWCRQRFPESQVTYQVADLLNFDADWQADFVFECRNIQALPLEVRSHAINTIAQLVAPQGTLLVVTQLRTTEAPPSGPPWPLSEAELSKFQALGLKEVNRDQFIEGEFAITQARIEYRR